MKFKFFARFVVLAAAAFALLSFNWDRIELENRAFVVTLGIDAGEDAPFEVSMNIANAVAIEGGDDGHVVKRTATGESLAHAMGLVEANISDKIYFGHTKAIILGEGVLEDENLLREAVDTLFRNNEINIKAIVMAADGSAADVLGAKPHKDGLLGVYLASFYNNNNANTAAMAVKLDLEGLASGLMADGSAVIPKIAIEDDEDELAIGGIAVVRNFALAGHVEEEDMGGLLWVLKNAAGTQIPIEESGGHITLLVANSKARLNFYEEGGKIHCNVRLKAEGSIEGAAFMDDRLFDADALAGYEAIFGDEIQDKIGEIFYIFQDKGVDGLGLHEQVRKKEWRLYQRYENDWPQAFREMALSLDVEVKIRNTGAIK